MREILFKAKRIDNGEWVEGYVVLWWKWIVKEEVKQMERLTERYKDPIANTVLIKECGDKLCKNICDDIEYDCSKCGLEKALEKLADYEDLEEQGLLVRLPVPLGSKVYWISTRDKQNPIIFEKIFVLGMLYFWDSTVFAIREEAEKKLEEMKKNEP